MFWICKSQPGSICKTSSFIGSVVAFNILVLVGTIYINLHSNWKEPKNHRTVLKIHERKNDFKISGEIHGEI